MDLNRYRFVTAWELDAPMPLVVEVLADLAGYPGWWPEVRAVRQLDETSGHLVIRSLLPYSLRVTLRRSRRDEPGGVLEASMCGDLDGFSRWTVAGLDDGRTRAVFEEDVIARKALLRLFGPVARPLFRLNHAVMMRHGLRGLTRYLDRLANDPDTPAGPASRRSR